ncbi:trypsin-like peptidase domain-containing protein, partial [Anaplasma marginale]|uniref:trypsin-like peptidase domain-containing protein n=1 Tax=Anaplasma marginale TaxID=770 RepID=UPI0005B509FD
NSQNRFRKKWKRLGSNNSKEGDTYYIVTAAHVVANKDKYQIVTPDGEKYNLKPEDILTAASSDAAIIKFRSNKNYTIAKIAKYNLSFAKKQWVVCFRLSR